MFENIPDSLLNVFGGLVNQMIEHLVLLGHGVVGGIDEVRELLLELGFG